ncbi:uncharacterized protein LY79DRAFT_67292 [Colletotrichum navitas]|uniref:Uncharacterized protein n=1 Tax=Colletotrichum navitas TaxID=681940 RepID=A0AAD8UY42_9PEZI|nr:uncharacterized protein LY79DRAFT_67292 [Colletotrichum navitas]KAK1569776.1 hypothetical protein LY79DRAFT_67292 [Colletotrichum navitas]
MVGLDGKEQVEGARRLRQLRDSPISGSESLDRISIKDQIKEKADDDEGSRDGEEPRHMIPPTNQECHRAVHRDGPGAGPLTKVPGGRRVKSRRVGWKSPTYSGYGSGTVPGRTAA